MKELSSKDRVDLKKELVEHMDGFLDDPDIEHILPRAGWLPPNIAYLMAEAALAVFLGCAETSNHIENEGLAK